MTTKSLKSRKFACSLLFALAVIVALPACGMGNHAMSDDHGMMKQDSMAQDDAMMMKKDDMSKDQATMMKKDEMSEDHGMMMKKEGMSHDGGM